MDNNLNQTPPVNPQIVPTGVKAPQVPPISSISQSLPLPTAVPEPKKGPKMKMIIALVIVLVILGGLGFFGYSYFKTAKTYNAGVYNYPTAVPASPTPTDVVNPNDTTDSAIDSDNKVIDQGLNNLNSDINGVDQSLNDKQTNLQ